MNARRRFGAIAGAAVLTTGLAAGLAAGLPGSADAAQCTSAQGATTTCTTNGTITLTGGLLSMGGPATLTWGGAVTGAAQTIYDTSSSADQTLFSSDLRGLPSSNAGSGWDITALATTFTGGTTGATLAASGVLAIGGGSTAGTATARPTAACVVVLTCAVPTPPGTGAITYPAAVPTGGSTAAEIYNGAAGSGTGLVQIGGGSAASPAVWQVTLPALVTADTYTSTVTLTIAAGP